MVVSELDRIPESAAQAHELLAFVEASGRAPGVYYLPDLDVEYQIARDDSATRRIANMLDSLEDHAELLDTVRAYLANDMSRRRTARRLYVHPDTVDHR